MIPVTTRELGTGAPRAVAAGLGRAGRGLRSFLRLSLATTAGKIGLPIVLIHFTLALFGPWLAPYSPTEFNYRETGELKQLQGPSWEHWLGTDQFGRDILSRVMSGATSIIAVSFAGAALGIALGTLVGMSSAYKGGWLDEIGMRVMDGLMSFPSLLLALLVMSTLASEPAPVQWIEPIWEHILIVGTISFVTMPRWRG